MTLNVVTYNMNGFNTSVAYVKQLSKNYEIILVHEHMLRAMIFNFLPPVRLTLICF